MSDAEKKQEPEKHERPKFSEHPLEAFLGLFGDVRPGEGVTVLLLALNVFVLLAAYYLLKVAREQLILAGAGAELKSYSAAGQSIILIFVAAGYGWLAGRVGRFQLITIVTLFFAANLVIFWFLGITDKVPLAIPFFLWVGVFNIVTTTQIYSFAADLYTDEQGKRLLAVVGIGGSIGAAGGAGLANGLVRLSGGSPYLLMAVAAGILVASLGITFVINKRDTQDKAKSPAEKAPDEKPVGSGNAFAMVIKDRYLLFILLLVFVLNIVTKTGDYVLDKMVLDHAHELAKQAGAIDPAAVKEFTQKYIGEFKSPYFFWINAVGVVLQLFAVSRIIKYFGVKVALILIPLASLGGYATALFAPFIGVLFVGRVVESSLDYSLSNTARQALWLVTTREAKYKAKQVIDTFIVRFGDAPSAAIVWIGTEIKLSHRGFLAVNVVFCIAWILVTLLVNREYGKKGEHPPPKDGAQPKEEAAPDGEAAPA